MARYYRYDGVSARDLSTIPCPICGGDRARELGVDNGFCVTRCADDDCGFVFVNPRPTARQLEALYADYYDADATIPEKWEREMGAIFRECREWLLERAPSGRVLDVGCSFGHFLRAMEDAGWTATGVEPNAVAAEHAGRLIEGRILRASFEDAALANESFDAVVSLYVLEHVADPRAFLSNVHRVLAEGGLAIIRIPYTAPLFPLARLLRRPLMYAPMHLNDFAPRAMRRLAKDVGFRDVDVRVGERRRAHDVVERTGALVLGGAARAVEIATRGRVLFPFAGALSYRLVK